MMSFDKKHHVEPNLSCLDGAIDDTDTNMVPKVLVPKMSLHCSLIVIDQMNAIVPLMTPLASCGTGANTTGITWPNKCCMSVVHPVV